MLVACHPQYPNPRQQAKYALALSPAWDTAMPILIVTDDRMPRDHIKLVPHHIAWWDRKTRKLVTNTLPARATNNARQAHGISAVTS